MGRAISMPSPRKKVGPRTRPSKERPASHRAVTHRERRGEKQGEKGRFDLETLVRLPSLLYPKLSWARDRLAYFWDGTGRLELYVRSTDVDDVRQVSHGEVPRSLRWRPTWDRTDRSLVFIRDVGGDERYDLFRIGLDSAEVRQLTDRPADSYPSEFSPDNRWILFRSNMAGKGGRAQSNLWRVGSDGGTPEQLTDYASPVSGFGFGTSSWSPNGRQIAYSANETDDPRNQDVYVCDADGSNARRVFRGRIGSADGVAAWHPDGRRLLILSDASGRNRPGVLDLEKETVQWYGDGRRDEIAGEFSPDGSSLLTILLDGVRVVPRSYSLTTLRGSDLRMDGGVVMDAEFAPDGRSVLAWYQSPIRRGEFARLSSHRPPQTLLPAEYGSLDRSRLVNPRTVHYKTFDGRQIEALLYVPKHPKRRNQPALIEVHGGPTGQFFRYFDYGSQYFASRGFVVLEPNIRGSTGYGAEFQDLNRKDWGGGDLRDVVAGARYLAKLPYVDPKRLGIWGGSFGGFMTYLATVKEPDLWRAACAWVGVTDLELLYKESREHYKYYFHEQMGDPEKDRDLWRDRSAVHFADRLRAKLLIVHGTNDPRCPIDQARVYRDRLIALGRREGRDFEYHELGEEGHGSADIEQKLRSTRIMSDFFERTLASPDESPH
jgi:dipeptidyl aminopeptidase/acylaminoacyl peptidase